MDLISSRLHKSWLSDVQLLPALAASDGAQDTWPTNLPWMLTACNDGTLALWDPSQVDSSGRFAQLACASDVHSRGIFSMHMRPSAHGAAGLDTVEVLTASRDSTVALTAVQAGAMRVVRQWDNLHCDTVKCVRWRDLHTAATAGNDRCGLAVPPLPLSRQFMAAWQWA